MKRNKNLREKKGKTLIIYWQSKFDHPKTFPLLFLLRQLSLSSLNIEGLK